MRLHSKWINKSTRQIVEVISQDKNKVLFRLKSGRLNYENLFIIDKFKFNEIYTPKEKEEKQLCKK